MELELPRRVRESTGSFLELIELGPKAIFHWVVFTGPLFLRVSALVFLILTFIIAFLFLRGVSNTDRLFLETLTSSVGSAYSYRSTTGLEALVLPEFREEEANSAILTRPFVRQYGKFQRLLRQLGAGAESPTSQPKSATQRKLTTSVISSPGPAYGSDLEVVSLGPSIKEKYFSEKHSISFLFLPAFVLLQEGPTDEAPLAPTADDQALLKSVLSSRALSRDLQISQSVDELLCDLTDTPIIEPSDSSVLDPVPRQAYFITARGLLRICEGHVLDQATYYRGQFAPSTFFPSRPYFQDTIRQPERALTDNPKFSSFFFRTSPYIDLGGNGVVITACRALDSYGVGDSVLCLDFAFSRAMIQQVQQRLSNLGAANTIVSCSMHENDIQCDNHIVNLQKTMRQLLSSSALSDIFGTIIIVKKDANSLQFAVPISRTVADNSNRGGTFLYCDVDLAKIQRRNLMRATALTMSLAFSLFFLLLLIVDYGGRMVEQRKAFDAVAQVMFAVPVPYCRGDISSGLLIDFNEAFARLLGYNSLVEAKKELSNKTFMDLIATDEGRQKYSAIREARKRDNPVGDYSLSLRKVSDDVVWVRVYGAVVPTPEGPGGQFQQTFGILVPEALDFRAPGKA